MSDGQGTSTAAAATGVGDSGNAQAAAQAAAQGEQAQSTETNESSTETVEKPVTKEVSETTEKSESTEEAPKELNDVQRYLTEKYKDHKFESDDDYYKKIMERFAENDEYIAKNKEINEKFYNILEANPEVVQYLKNIGEGMDPEEALVRSHNMEILIDKWNNSDSYPDASKLKEIKAEKLQKLTDRKAKEKAFNDNSMESKKVIDAFVTEHDLSKEEAKQFFDDIDELYSELTQGIVSKKHLTLMRKGLMLDKAVEDAAKDAAAEATIKTKNEKIDILKSKKKDGDHVPRLESAETDTVKAPEQDWFSKEIDNLNENEKKLFAGQGR